MASSIHHQAICVHSALSNSTSIPGQTICSDMCGYTMSTRTETIHYYERCSRRDQKAAVEVGGED
jgi:hypothetical protein